MSAGTDGELWALDSDGDPWRWDVIDWVKDPLPGAKGAQISATIPDIVWCVCTDGRLWARKDGGWFEHNTLANGSHLDFGPDGVGLTIGRGGNLSRKDGQPAWRSIGGPLDTKRVAVGSADHSWRIDGEDRVSRQVSGDWVQPNDTIRAQQISVGGDGAMLLIDLEGTLLGSKDEGRTWTRLEPQIPSDGSLPDTYPAARARFVSVVDSLRAVQVDADGKLWRRVTGSSRSGGTGSAASANEPTAVTLAAGSVTAWCAVRPRVSSPSNEDPTVPPQKTAPPRSDESDLETIEGTIDRITFHSEESRFTVLRVRTERPVAGIDDPSPLFSPLVTAVGATPRPSEGLAVRLLGRWSDHKDHGRQFEFSRLEVRPPTDTAGLVKYLSSSTFQGVGATLAQRIVDKLGPESLDRIKDEPGALDGIRGLSQAVAEGLIETVRAETGTHELHAFLLGLGLGPWQVEAVIERFGAQAEDKLRADPYLLSIGVEGIGFRTADQVAQKLGLAPDGLERRRAGLLHVLRTEIANGHSFVPVAELFGSVRELLGGEFGDDALVEALEGLRKMREVQLDEHEGGEPTHASVERVPLLRAWTSLTYACETGLAERLTNLLGAGRPEPWADAEQVERLEERFGLHLDERQREAVLGLLSHPVAVLTGGPGVGKTTVMRLVVELALAKGARVALASPTGRAAKRLAEATDHEASTVHRLLGFDPEKGRFAHDAERPIDTDLLVVDEVSMLDLALAYSLVKAVRPPTRLVWIGDPDQLPSVAAGNVLADLLASHRVPTWRLTKIFRQSAASRIVTNAHRVLEGRRPELPPKDERSDFYFFPTDTEQATAERVVEVVTQRIPKTFGHDWTRDVQVLSPMYRGACGVDELNERLRAELPGRAEPTLIRGRPWREGDRVIHTRNDYERDVFNGDMGRVTSIDVDGKGLVVSYPERALHYDARELSDLQPAFAITVHRSQGGEFPAVVIPIVTQHYVMLQRHLFYTAITRAKRLCVLVGQQRAIDMAIENDRGNLRRSALAERLVRIRDDQA